jgi:hypothetical protein
MAATVRHRRGVWTVPGLALALLVGVAAQPSAASAAELTVPKRLKPGAATVFKGTDFEPNTRLTLGFLKDGWGQDSMLVFREAFPTDADGAVTMRFRLPRSWRACEGDHGRGHENRPKKCQRVRWKVGEKVYITAQSHVEPYSHANVVSRIGRPAPKPLTVPAGKGGAVFRAVCALGRRCGAKVTIKAGKRTLAQGRYSIPGRSSRKVRLRLTPAGRAALASRRRVDARATLVDTATGKRKSVPVILKRR